MWPAKALRNTWLTAHTGVLECTIVVIVMMQEWSVTPDQMQVSWVVNVCLQLISSVLPIPIDKLQLPQFLV